MLLIQILLVLLTVLIILHLGLTIRAGRTTRDGQDGELKFLVQHIQANLKDNQSTTKNEFATNRAESAQSARDLRTEIIQQVNTFGKSVADHTNASGDRQNRQFIHFSEQLQAFTRSMEEKFMAFQQHIDSGDRENRKELKEHLEIFKKSLETSVRSLQEGNERKLEEMRKTVDEKLNDTLEKRLGESFKLVSERLEAVHKGLGDMQHLAVSVGDLKKVMSNVKSRGILGEYQLQNILEDLLTNEQYGKNVKTKPGSGALVEFAIKMPHGHNLEKILWMPVDSKFPKEDYEALVDAYETSDHEHIETCRKAFVRSIRKCAQDIREKYIDPPHTTEYGIMFLPFESLYAEVLRVPGLFEQLQKEFKITITGPTTLSALLNSLQMGFRTLAIEKRSGEVWDLLGAVKTEFGKFGDVLAKTKKKLMEATQVIDDSETRTRAIERKLRNVQELPQEQTKGFLNEGGDPES